MEAPQGLLFKLQPLTIVRYQVLDDSVLDLSTAAARAAAGRRWAPWTVSGRLSRTPLQHRLAAERPKLDGDWRWEFALPDSLKPTTQFLQRADRAFFEMAFLTCMRFSWLVDADFIETEAFYARTDGDKPPVRGGQTAPPGLRDALDAHLDRPATTASASPVSDRRAAILRHVRSRAGQALGHFSLTVATGGG